MALVYLDSSAIVKLVVREPESDALFAELSSWRERVSSALARVEVLRALKRADATAAGRRRAEAVLARTALLRIDGPILRDAARVEPPMLRTLDAIHLASALSIGADLDALVTYDPRLASAATRARLQVLSPGRRSS